MVSSSSVFPPSIPMVGQSRGPGQGGGSLDGGRKASTPGFHVSKNAFHPHTRSQAGPPTVDRGQQEPIPSERQVWGQPGAVWTLAQVRPRPKPGCGGSQVRARTSSPARRGSWSPRLSSPSDSRGALGPVAPGGPGKRRWMSASGRVELGCKG